MKTLFKMKTFQKCKQLEKLYLNISKRKNNNWRVLKIANFRFNDALF